MPTNAEYVRTFSAGLARFGQDTEAKATAVIREAAETTLEAIAIGNEFGPGAPIDTGFLRASIRAGVNAPDDSAGRIGAQGATYTPDGNAGVIATAKLGDEIYITTPAEYAVYLETLPLTRIGGAHPGQPTPFVGPVAARWDRIVEDAVDRVGYGRESGRTGA